jgi:hypothetical protein
MMPMIHLALADDWELRGDGSGNMEKIQFEPLRRLLEIYEANGLTASINAEVMQQLSHRRHSAKYPALGRLADRWDETLAGAVRRGHDVQLHTHCQWSRSSFDGTSWQLDGDWNITNYDQAEAAEMIACSKAYLESLLRQVDPAYSVVSYRAGSWAIAPSPHMMQVLSQNGIELDVSIVAGLRVANSKVCLDYTSVEEGFLPFYPLLSDARRVSSRRERIVCLPTFSFVTSLPFFAVLGLTHVATTLLARAGVDFTHLTRKPSHVRLDKQAPTYSVWAPREKSLTRRMLAKLEGRNRFYIADLSEMSGLLWRLMLDEIRRKARSAGWQAVPVVLENHTKDLGDMRNIEAFARHVSRQSDIRVVRLRDIAANLRTGVYPVRMA